MENREDEVNGQIANKFVCTWLRKSGFFIWIPKPKSGLQFGAWT
jgi:hypothetical protein